MEPVKLNVEEQLLRMRIPITRHIPSCVHGTGLLIAFSAKVIRAY